MFVARPLVVALFEVRTGPQTPSLDEFGWNRKALRGLIGFGDTIKNRFDELFPYQLRKFPDRTQSWI